MLAYVFTTSSCDASALLDQPRRVVRVSEARRSLVDSSPHPPSIRQPSQIREVVAAQGIRIYQPPIEDDDQASAEHARTLASAMPFSIIGSTLDVVTPDGRTVKGREYLWGVAEGSFALPSSCVVTSDSTFATCSRHLPALAPLTLLSALLSFFFPALQSTTRTTATSASCVRSSFERTCST